MIVVFVVVDLLAVSSEDDLDATPVIAQGVSVCVLVCVYVSVCLLVLVCVSGAYPDFFNGGVSKTGNSVLLE